MGPSAPSSSTSHGGVPSSANAERDASGFEASRDGVTILGERRARHRARHREPRGGAGQRQAPDVGAAVDALTLQAVEHGRGGQIAGAVVEQLARKRAGRGRRRPTRPRRSRSDPARRCRTRAGVARARGGPRRRGRPRRLRDGASPARLRSARTGRAHRGGNRTRPRRRRPTTGATSRGRRANAGRAVRCACRAACRSLRRAACRGGGADRDAAPRHRERRGSGCTPARRSLA